MRWSCSASNYILGLTPVQLPALLGGTVAGMSIWSLLYASLGAASRKLLDEGTDLEVLLAGEAGLLEMLAIQSTYEVLAIQSTLELLAMQSTPSLHCLLHAAYRIVWCEPVKLPGK